MNVLVPLNNRNHVSEYIKSGAGEFYIGFYDELWTTTFGEYGDMNRMSGYGKDANCYTFQEILAIIQEMKIQKLPLYITFNSSIYNKNQLERIRNYIKRLKEANVDGVIVSNYDLVCIAKEEGVPSVVSTIAGVYNSDLALFYRKAGAKRIILPRDLSVEEIASIVTRVPDVEYEVFMMRNGCAFSDSNCLGLHRSEMCSICASIGKSDKSFYIQDKDFTTLHDMELNHKLYADYFHDSACGLCAIYDFVKLGITAGKIVGRSDEWNAVCEDIHIVHENVAIAKVCKTKEEYLEKMQFPKNRNDMCKLGLSCYYPEIRFGLSMKH